MALKYNREAGAIRGSQKQIVALRARLARGLDASGVAAELLDAGVTPRPDPEDAVLEGMSAALAAPILTVHLTNAGPGGVHRHVIEAGTNACVLGGVRQGLTWLSSQPRRSPCCLG